MKVRRCIKSLMGGYRLARARERLDVDSVAIVRATMIALDAVAPLSLIHQLQKRWSRHARHSLRLARIERKWPK